MKKIFLLVFTSILAVSCVDDSNKLPQDYPDTGWIQLNDAADQTYAAVGSFELPVELGVGNNESGQVISYNVALVSPTGPASLQLGEFNFSLAPGKQIDMLSIPLANDGTNYELEITLVKTSNSDYTIGLSDNSKKIKHRVKVCGLTIEDFVGTYAVREAFSAGINAGLSLAAVFGEQYEMKAELDPADTEFRRLLLSNSGANIFISPDPIGVTLDPCSNSPQTIELSDDTPTLALFANLNVSSSTYDATNFSFTIEGSLGTFGPYRIELRKL